MNLRTDIQRLHQLVLAIRELRNENWQDGSGVEFDRNFLSALEDVTLEYAQAVRCFDAEIEDALARL